MRAYTLVVLTLALSGWSAAQTVYRGGGISPIGGPGATPGPRVSSPAAPTSGAAATADPRLGAGNAARRPGNVIFPGTPGRTSTGNVNTPGTPVAPVGGGMVVRPADPPSERPYHRGDRYGRRGQAIVPVFVPVFGMYGYAATPNVIEVQSSARTRSNASHVIEVGKPGSAADPVGEEGQVKLSEGPLSEVPPAYWLIALRGGLIYAVSEYGTEDRAVWFVTVQGDEYVVPPPRSTSLSRRSSTPSGAMPSISTYADAPDRFSARSAKRTSFASNSLSERSARRLSCRVGKLRLTAVHRAG
jgi:hypothetical protein